MLLGKTALITGATGGIGSAFAMVFAKSGYNLILTGRKEHELGFLQDSLSRRYGIRVEIVRTDLAKDMKTLYTCIDAHHRIDVLVNNAGFGLAGAFEGSSLKKQLSMVKVHIDATMELTHKVLPKMEKGSAIINTSSVVGILPMPDSPVYSATKSFLVSFSETLSMQLRRRGIRVQALCPGLTYSHFHDGKEVAKPKGGYWMKPEDVVRKSLRCLRRNKVVCVPGFANRLFVFLHWLLPRWAYYLIVRNR